MRKNIAWIMISLIGLFLFSGCGKEEIPTVSGITLNDDGAIEALIIDEFDENVYSISGLNQMIESEIAEYNIANGQGSVSLVGSQMIEGNVHVTMNYASVGDYSAFNNRRFEVESLDSAISSSKLNVSFKSVKTGEQEDIKSLENTEKYSVIITDEAGRLVCPHKILFVSDGVETISSKEVLVTDNMDGLAYIIFSNK